MSMITTDPKLEIILTAKDMAASTFKQVEGYATNLRKSIFSLNGAITGLAGSAGMGYLANQSLALTAEMKKNADMAGVSAKAYQELTFAASKYQVTQDALMDGMKELSLRADEFVITGAGPAKEAFERLGFSQAELNKKMKDTPALLLDIIDRMQGLGDAAKIRIADEIFGGTGGEQFVTMINAGSGAIEELTRKANDLGLVMSDETAAGAVEAYNAVKTLTAQLQTQFNTVIAELAPDLSDAAESMSEWVSENKEFLTQDIPRHIREIGGAVSFLSEKMSGYARNIAVNSQAFALLTEGQITLKQFLTSSTNELAKLVEDFDSRMGNVRHSIDKNTEGFDRYAKGADNAGKSTKDLVHDLGTVVVTADKAAVSLKDLQVQAALDSYFEDLDNFDAHLREKEQMTANAEQSMADIRIQQALDSYFKDIDNYEEVQQAKAAAAEKARQDRERAEEKARQEYEREWERVYDDMHEFAADTFYGLFKKTEGFWGNLLGTMEDMFIRSVSNMVAHAAMTNIFKPIMNSIAGSFAGNFFGLPTASGTGFNMPGIGSIGNLLSGKGIMGMLPSGWVNPAYQGPGMGAAVSPASMNWAGVGSSLGTVAVGGLFAAVGTKLIDDILSRNKDKPGISFFGDDHYEYTRKFGGKDIDPYTETYTKYHLGPKSQNFDYWIKTRETGQDAELQRMAFEYFDRYFAAVEETLNISVNDVLAQNKAFSATTGYPSQVSFGELSKQVFERFLPDLLNGLFESIPRGIDTDFFKAIAPEEGSEWDAFLQFAQVKENTEDFIAELTRRIDDLGMSAVDAYGQIQTITGVFAEMEAAYKQVVGSSLEDVLRQSISVWDQYILVLKESQATAEQVAEAEHKKNAAVGSQLTGITQASLSQALLSGTDIDQLVSNAMQQAMASQLANQLMTEYMAEFNAAAYRAFEESGWDGYINLVNSYDFGPAKAAYKSFVQVVEQETRDLTQAIKNAQSTYDQAKDAYLDRLRDELSILEGSLADAKDNYISLLQDEWTILQSDYDASKSVLEQVISNEERLIDARRNAAASIDSFIAGLQGSTRAPVQSLEFFERRYGQLLSEARSASPEDVSSAVSSLTQFTGQYLDFAAAYGGDNQGRYNSVMEDLRNLQADQLQAADSQEAKLSDVKSAIGLSNEALKSLSLAFASYRAARDALNEGKWMEQELDALQKAEGWTESIYEAQEAYYAAKRALDDNWYQDEIDVLENTKESLDSLKQAMEDAYGDMVGELDNLFGPIGDELAKIPEAIDLLLDEVEKIPTSLDKVKGDLAEVMGQIGAQDEAAAESFVELLYKTIGREGIGTAVDQIDQEGWDYWLDMAKRLGSEGYASITTAFGDEVQAWLRRPENEGSALAEYLESIGVMDEFPIVIKDLSDVLADLSKALYDFNPSYGDPGAFTPGAGDPGTTIPGEANTDWIKNAYRAIGRSGFGDAVYNIDREGFSNWEDYLKANPGLSEKSFYEDFYDEVLDYISSNPKDPISDYVSKSIKSYWSKIPDYAVPDDYSGSNNNPPGGNLGNNDPGSINEPPENWHMDYVKRLYDSIDRGPLWGSAVDEIDYEGWERWKKIALDVGYGNYDELFEQFKYAVNKYIAENPGDKYAEYAREHKKFMYGGIISGPMSGYQMPDATFHGTEAIIPLRDGAVPVQMQNNSQPINLTARITIGDREVKDFNIELVRTDSEMQYEVRRVANG